MDTTFGPLPRPPRAQRGLTRGQPNGNILGLDCCRRQSAATPLRLHSSEQNYRMAIIGTPLDSPWAYNGIGDQHFVSPSYSTLSYREIDTVKYVGIFMVCPSGH